METRDVTESRLMIQEDQVRKTVLLLRWILIIVIGYLIVFSNPNRPVLSLPYLLLMLYFLSNLLLLSSPRSWFEKELFIFWVLLFDIGVTSSAIYITAKMDSEFYLIYFLILFIASLTQRAKFLYFSAGLLLISYGLYSYLKAPLFFMEPVFLLRFSFIFVVIFFFNLMIESYNRVRQEKDLLKEDYRELEILSELAQSIGQHKRLADYLFGLNQILCQKLPIERCTSILVDKQGKEARISFSDDIPENELTVIDLLKTPSFKASLHKNREASTREGSSGSKAISGYSLKQMPLWYNEERLGTLYLRVNTPLPRLTHREAFFLNRLAKITATALNNLERTRVLEKPVEFSRDWIHNT